ncbi:winged helix-turn-helix transcriptional regulator [Chitinophaga nivalis]|uniref:Helix-turn-helix transcriptional regulator n=1 Tax=Chitinophaga nivalis TaxID=2991709 RepID=A0ABT3IS73_9BACT|nr:helix-turn-helix domain-containing protein [Chitinophaga nivalis]MCW3463482.1 helix-turn-helix transcriptional regulator [Chitinophaga nivalis]MCW3486828.1 helix-turn-helix transcriptional regulator [Chitinophaga nivalis]
MLQDPKLTDQSCNASLRAIDDALYVIGGKWKLRIIAALSDGKTRFNELQRKVSGISARVLSAELKELELNGFIKKHVSSQTPAIAEYELTQYSLTLDTLLHALSDWGAQHLHKIRGKEAEPEKVAADQPKK